MTEPTFAFLFVNYSIISQKRMERFPYEILTILINRQGIGFIVPLFEIFTYHGYLSSIFKSFFMEEGEDFALDVGAEEAVDCEVED